MPGPAAPARSLSCTGGRRASTSLTIAVCDPHVRAWASRRPARFPRPAAPGWRRSRPPRTRRRRDARPPPRPPTPRHRATSPGGRRDPAGRCRRRARRPVSAPHRAAARAAARPRRRRPPAPGARSSGRATGPRAARAGTRARSTGRRSPAGQAAEPRSLPAAGAHRRKVHGVAQGAGLRAAFAGRAGARSSPSAPEPRAPRRVRAPSARAACSSRRARRSDASNPGSTPPASRWRASSRAELRDPPPRDVVTLVGREGGHRLGQRRRGGSRLAGRPGDDLVEPLAGDAASAARRPPWTARPAPCSTATANNQLTGQTGPPVSAPGGLHHQEDRLPSTRSRAPSPGWARARRREAAVRCRARRTHASGSLAGEMSALDPSSRAQRRSRRTGNEHDGQRDFATPSSTASRHRRRPAEGDEDLLGGSVVSPMVWTTMSTLTMDAVTAGAPVPTMHRPRRARRPRSQGKRQRDLQRHAGGEAESPAHLVVEAVEPRLATIAGAGR